MLWFYPARLNQEVRVVCNAPHFTPKWHSVCTEMWICVYTQIHATPSAWAFITPVTGCVIAQLRCRPCWALTHAVCFVSRQSLSQDQCGAVAISTSPAATARKHPSTHLRDMKVDALICCLQIPRTASYSISSPPLLCLQCRRNPTVTQANLLRPFRSYPIAEQQNVRGGKGSHWWAVLCKTKASVSNWRSSALDDFWWITALISAPVFLLLLLLPVPWAFALPILVSRWAFSPQIVLECPFFVLFCFT